MTPKYELAVETRGCMHHDDLRYAVVRRNYDRSIEVVARFHSRLLAEEYAKSMNAEVMRVGAVA